jgi:predicted transcriptional regulator
MKLNASTRLESDLMKRAESLAEKDHRTLANVIEMCVINHLPVLEREVLGVEQSVPSRKQKIAA